MCQNKLSAMTFSRVLLVVCFSIYGSIAMGKTSESLVQEILFEQGYYSGSINGKFGSKSKKALIKYI
jgi:hypothetical protein